MSLSSWAEGADAHKHFTIYNLPFGVFSTESQTARVGVAIGDLILDLTAVAKVYKSIILFYFVIFAVLK